METSVDALGPIKRPRWWNKRYKLPPFLKWAWLNPLSGLSYFALWNWKLRVSLISGSASSAFAQNRDSETGSRMVFASLFHFQLVQWGPSTHYQLVFTECLEIALNVTISVKRNVLKDIVFPLVAPLLHSCIIRNGKQFKQKHWGGSQIVFTISFRPLRTAPLVLQS